MARYSPAMGNHHITKIETTMSDLANLKPQFFITRQNGALVPLIAMDELPIHVQIRGVPRSMTAFDITGMTPLGLVEARHQYYVVESLNNSNTTPNKTAPAHAMSETPPEPSTERVSFVVPFNKLASTVIPIVKFPTSTEQSGDSATISSFSEESKTNTPAQTSTESGPPTGTIPVPAWRQHASTNNNTPNTTPTTPTKIDDIKPPTTTGQEPGANIPLTGKKVYCSYWLRKGECDFAQQGCIYKHEMPTDLETLLTVGFTDIPLWYRQRYGLGSLLVEGGRNNPSYGLGDRNVPRSPAPASAPAHVPARKFQVGDNAKRMVHNQLGVRSYSPRGGRYGGGGGRGGHGQRCEVDLRAQIEAEEQKRKQTEEDILAVIKLDEEEEKQRQALARKYKCLAPERRSVFVGHEDLMTETFSNGEEPNDLMAKIKKIEQRGWEEEQAERMRLAQMAEKERSGAASGGGSKKGGDGKGKKSGGGPKRKAGQGKTGRK
ncbi:hypothetical protein LTR99_005995 [Exophiala xenobiotica]|uniref:C3H1-type domain-containing protein n=1 Tax=Vermiconidia calcicola TaxID=1690605 RepID=A0AAV9QDL3_9PEZI|nr:hypothetical protein LTR92_006116 [Exophiala xenobiotica]KAK5540933.1 hypothetical protein LTR25_002710 [Vermiconidia calcicola]KAK5267046.1 hypothetical protein LTR96_007713 [Exophiala xenobiotica]KAK5297198.1 hypothetical protein LTR14_002929 [Exophiala xenobiotica]KAK5303038.1 hypothetical protein LTR99_005995 [Exophiala xenobiotica]